MNRPRRILAPVDFSDQSQTIVDTACEIATQSGGEVHLVHVDSTTGMMGRPQASTYKILERLGGLVRPSDELEIRTKKAVLEGQPHRAIVDYSIGHHVDLIVMGTHGRSGLSHLALGSVAERVLRHAPCPVQVVKSYGLPDNKRLERAIDALTDQFGNTLSGTRRETESSIASVLGDALKISDAAARELLDELVNREWLTWQQETAARSDDATLGKWEFVIGMEFLDDPQAEFAPATTNIAGVDLVIRARKLRATDIHVDPLRSGESRVRFRIDGQLEEYCRLERTVAEHQVNQWKLLAGLDTSDPFRAKEGRVDFPEAATDLADVEARFTSAPVAGGEAVALRLCRRSDLYIPLQQLGLSESSMAAVDQMLSTQEGLVVVSGPTGSGKTTTVYSMLESISSSNRNIVSIEDPVEFPVPFVRQMSVDERHGVTMTQGLRTLLRMDPDVIFLGEVRDSEAARLAMRAAASGRYVFSTLHARDIAAAITALRNLGLSDRSLAANVSGIINQRLIRRLCPDCRREINVTEELKQRCDSRQIEVPPRQYERVGCGRCRGTGYFGRVGIFEAVSFTEEIRNELSHGQPESQFRSQLATIGLTPLSTDALLKVAEGVTDLDEILRVHWV